ncbi:MAG: hypothetical protein LBM98_05680, partial [Oscillospiraceae bacterium]|nr:hypothetical protein [Oscillospiraceae bacterium]
APDKTTLHEYKAEIERFLAERLKLSLNDKTAIRPVSDGVAFCGYRIWGSHVKLRKTTAKYLKRRLRKLMSDYAVGKVDYEDAQRVIASYKGILQHCDSYALRTAIYGDWDENGKRGGWFVLQRNSEQNNNTGDGE